MQSLRRHCQVWAVTHPFIRRSCLGGHGTAAFAARRWTHSDGGTSAGGGSINKSKTNRGLFCIPELETPSSFVTQAAAAIKECNALRDSFSEPPPIPTLEDARHVLYTLDAISRVVCNVIDAAELCRNVHSDSAWRQSADQTFHYLSDYISQLNSDMRLYQATLAVANADNSITQQYTAEEQRLIQSLREEFERDGVHLLERDDTGNRDEIRRLQQNIVALESTFSQNLVEWERTFDADRQYVEAVIPPSVLQQFGIVPPQNSSNALSLSANTSILQTLLKYSASPSLRKQVHMEYATAVPENKEILEDLRRQRHELAYLLGYPSHGHRFLQDKMVTSPAAVEAFLDNVVADSQAAFRADMTALSRAKQQLEGDTTLEAWDLSFYTGLCKAQSGEWDPSRLAPYLSLPNTIEAIQILCTRLFGIVVQPVEMTDDERWDDGQGGLVRLDFSTDDGTPLGILYLDLHPRPYKYGHAAHFTVRCGCRLLSDDGKNDEYQLPVVALVCNLVDRGAGGVLSHSEVETVFHELGHGKMRFCLFVYRTLLSFHFSSLRSSAFSLTTHSPPIEQLCIPC